MEEKVKRWQSISAARGNRDHQVVNQSRNLGRQTLSMFEPAQCSDASAFEKSEVQRQIILLQVAYVHSLRCQLRGLLPWKDLGQLLGEDDVERTH